MIATGVARPKAQGQLITSTEMARERAKVTVSPRASHNTNVRIAKTMTRGTKTPLTLSAVLAKGALVEAASCTSRMT